MLVYVIKRFIVTLFLLLGITFITFCIMNLAPGDMLAPVRHNPAFSKDTIKKMEKDYNLEGSTVERYSKWLGNLVFHGNMGNSFTQKKKVTEVIRGRAFNTILLSVTAMLFTWFVAIPLGIYAAVHQNTIGDRIAAFIAFFGMCMPGFFFCLLLLYVASMTGWLPIGGMTSGGYASFPLWKKIIDVAWHMIIPAIVIGTGSLGFLQRVMRGNMLEVLRMQYITTARAKGLPESRVVYKHALRNAINPMLTIFGYQLSGILSGAALVEIVISWPGLGSLMLESVRAQDVNLVMGSLLIGGVLLVMGNLIADILLAYADPRISYK